MAGRIGDIDLDRLSRDFMCASGEEKECSADDKENDYQENYGSRHWPFRFVQGMAGLLPDLRGRCIAPVDAKAR